MQPRESEVNYWLLATAPGDYGFADLEREAGTVWNGVTEYVSQKNLRDAEQGDMALILHQGNEPVIVGVARVVSDAYPDPAQDDSTIHVVDLEPVERLEHEIPLSALLDDPEFQDWELVGNPDLEVAEIPAPLWDRLITISREGLAQVTRERA
ncbi:MAG TPA: EVE domain-containing protein [Thermoanaerobaculia bacterium]|jgi:predicted RNA-binding protein with PUA-like domain|nr:EVE domain-containing protein [Thermoanaerobaculia bacterium]